MMQKEEFSMNIETFQYDRLVKSEDLNHHRTLFAGRCAEWFVEAGFIAAASVLPANNIVCLKIHGLAFTHPLQSGDITCFTSKIIHTGRTSLKVYVTVARMHEQEVILNGFITFVYVDDQGYPQPHGLTLNITRLEDIALNQKAKILR